jgi:hypothetical protein
MYSSGSPNPSAGRHMTPKPPASLIDWSLLSKDQQNHFFFLPALSRDSVGAPVPLTFSGVAGLSGCLPASRATRFEVFIFLTSHLVHCGI